MDELETINHVKLMLLCDHFSIDAQGKPSFIGVFEGVNSPIFPFSLTRFFFSVNIVNFEGKVVSLVLSLPNSKTMTLGSLDISHTNKVCNAAWEIANVTFEDPGLYSLTLQVDGQPIAKQLIAATLTTEQQQTEQQQNELHRLHPTPNGL